jgi:hypothetical protein
LVVNVDLFGNPVEEPASARRPVHARTDPTKDVFEAEKLIARGVHPVTLVAVRQGTVCGSCQFFEPSPALCRQARLATVPGWVGCQAFAMVERLDRKATGKTGVLHPPTSRRAGARVKAGSQQAAILKAVADSPAGLTAREAAEVIDRSVNQCGSRLLELRRAGLVRHVEPGDPIEAERDGALVHVATGHGRAEVAQFPT